MGINSYFNAFSWHINKYMKNLALSKKKGYPLVGNLSFWNAISPDRSDLVYLSTSSHGELSNNDSGLERAKVQQCSLRWELWVTTRWSGDETEISYRGNHSCLCNGAPSRNSEHWSSGEHPWLAILCMYFHTSGRKVRHPDSRGRGQWKFWVWHFFLWLNLICFVPCNEL